MGQASSARWSFRYAAHVGHRLVYVLQNKLSETGWLDELRNRGRGQTYPAHFSGIKELIVRHREVTRFERRIQGSGRRLANISELV